VPLHSCPSQNPAKNLKICRGQIKTDRKTQKGLKRVGGSGGCGKRQQCTKEAANSNSTDAQANCAGGKWAQFRIICRNGSEWWGKELTQRRIGGGKRRDLSAAIKCIKVLNHCGGKGDRNAHMEESW
jgi:hypothetical protein